MSDRPSPDVVVIGGGPAGAASARLLACWGHRVRLFARPPDAARGLAESLPPSTHKLLAQIGVLASIERAGFYRSTGNTVYWASREPRVESFDGLGFQVFRPDLDRVLIDAARDAGVEIVSSEFRFQTSDCPLVLDCSGRSGVIGRRHRIGQPEHRTVALVGVWRRADEWPLPDESHTVVETFDEGWAWSVPTSRSVRHVGVMVDRGAGYSERLARTIAMRRLVDGASLERTFACDASLYHAERFAGSVELSRQNPEPGNPEPGNPEPGTRNPLPGTFFLVGDAGSFIDPLSSFGVKKALASAWMAAVAAHTCLIDAARADAATAFFDAWERRVYDDHLRRSRDFARLAIDAHPHPFWTSRASVEVADRPDETDADVRVAFERIKDADEIEFAIADAVRFERQPVIRGNEIVLEPAFAAGLRFAADVDLVALAEIACHHRRVPDVYDAYCRTLVPTPLPNIVSGLSLLVARGILRVGGA